LHVPLESDIVPPPISVQQPQNTQQPNQNQSSRLTKEMAASLMAQKH